MAPRNRTHSRHNGRVTSQVVDALIAGKGLRPDDVYLAAGLTRSTFYNRMAKGDWKVSELADIAAILDEPIGSFFDGLGGRFTGETAVSGGGPGGGGEPDNSDGAVRDTPRFATLAA